MRKSLIAALALSGLMLAYTTPAYAGTYLFVSDSNTDSGIPAVLMGDGHRVTTVMADYAAGANPTLTGTISQYDAVIWSATGTGNGSTHNAATFTALATYVAGGGNVFVTGYDSIASPSDPNLIAFVGGTTSTDLVAATTGPPGAIISASNALTTGAVDIRGVTPTGHFADRDGLNTLLSDTVGVCPTTGSTTQWQMSLRDPAGAGGLIAYVSNGANSATSHVSWTTTTSGGAGAYNGALRNFAHNTAHATILFVTDTDRDNGIPAVLMGDGHRVTTVTGDYAAGANPTLTGTISQYDAIYWSATGTGNGSTHLAATMTALTTYVAGGGRVFVTGYDSIASPADPALIGFVGGTTSSDLVAATTGVPGVVISASNALTTGVVDIRGVTPTGHFADRDGLNDLMADTVGVCPTTGSTTQWQFSLRDPAGAGGVIAYVSNGANSSTSHVSWTTTTSGGAGAYNGALRNFGLWAATPDIAPVPATSPNGTACSAGSECTSTNCVDGVCCDTACGGGATDDCMACSTAAGAATAGTCGDLNGTVAPTVTCRASAAPCDAAEVCATGSTACPADIVAASGTECRAAADLCDAAEVCDGTATTCPADVVAASGTECRAAADLCDVAEMCDGTATTCPADAVAASGTECRAMADLCDVAEACDGTAVACPADAFAAAGTACRAAAGVCDLAEACDGAAATCPADMLMPDGMTCDDGMACFETDVCASGACVGSAVDCDDSDDCTADSCAEPGGCMNTAIAGCCAVDADCDDGDACTTDTCGGGTCSNEAIPGCSGTDAGMMGSDGGMMGGDGSVGTDGGVGADAGGGMEDGGCSCDVPASNDSPSHGAFLLLGLLGLVLVRRRRRR